MKRIFLLIAGCLVGSLAPMDARAQDWMPPMSHPMLLSGNFGELRNNHFHTGLDFKTGGTPRPVYAVQSGYVSRISVSPFGYGLALYLDHPNGTTTVYAHLSAFADSIAAYVKQEQYARESFAVNIFLSDTALLPVRKGQLIGRSGSTGSSGGPHLHFEIRDTRSQEVLDPLTVYGKRIRDTRPPEIQGVMVYPIEGQGVVNGGSQKVELKPVAGKNGTYHLPARIQAWGKIGLAIKAYDRMDNTTNIYGVKEITLAASRGDTLFHSLIDRFAFDQTRYLNSFIDYEEWILRRSFYIKSFPDPGNQLRFIRSAHRGAIDIDRHQKYPLTWHLTDAAGNHSHLALVIEGRQQAIPKRDTANTEYFHWASHNRFGSKGVRLLVERGNLYSDLYFHYSAKEVGDTAALSAIHVLHNTPVPLHRSARLSVRLLRHPTENKKVYGIERIHKGKHIWIGGSYRNGWIDVDIRELGTYAAAIDTVPPKIVPSIRPERWQQAGRIALRLSDNLSGIASFRGEIDGRYALFEMDSRQVVTCRFDAQRMVRGEHTLKMTVTDGCGNESLYTHRFRW